MYRSFMILLHLRLSASKPYPLIVNDGRISNACDLLFRYEMTFNTISVKYLIALFAGRVFCVKYNTVVFNIKLHVPKVTWAPSEYQDGLSRFGINTFRIRRSWDVCCLQISNESQAAICSCDDRQTEIHLARVPHICVNGLTRHCLRQWLVACSVPSH